MATGGQGARGLGARGFGARVQGARGPGGQIYPIPWIHSIYSNFQFISFLQPFYSWCQLVSYFCHLGTSLPDLPRGALWLKPTSQTAWPKFYVWPPKSGFRTDETLNASPLFMVQDVTEFAQSSTFFSLAVTVPFQKWSF